MLRLFSAVERGDIEATTQLVNQFPRIFDYEDFRKRNVLHIATEHGQHKMVEFLLGQGVDCYARDSCGYTPLHIAAELGHDKIVAQLSLHELKSDIGLLAPHLAAIKGHVSIVERLVATQPGLIDVQDHDGKTALHFAAEYAQEEVARRLIAGAEAIDKMGLSALHYAARCGNENIVAALLAERPELINAVTFQRLTPLHMAASYGHGKIVARLLAQDPQLERATDPLQRIALHFAAESGHEEVVQQLLEHSRFQIDACDRFGATALHYAARAARVRVVELLLAAKPAGISPQCCWDVLGTCDDKSCGASEKIMDLLLAHAPELISSVSNEGNTILHMTLLRDDGRLFSQDFVQRVWNMNPAVLRLTNSRVVPLSKLPSQTGLTSRLSSCNGASR